MSTENENMPESGQLPTMAWYKEQLRKLVAIRAFLISLEKEDSGGDECIIDWVKRVVAKLQSALTTSEDMIENYKSNPQLCPDCQATIKGGQCVGCRLAAIKTNAGLNKLVERALDATKDALTTSEAENKRLRGLVKDAYYEGGSDAINHRAFCNSNAYAILKGTEDEHNKV